MLSVLLMVLELESVLFAIAFFYRVASGPREGWLVIGMLIQISVLMVTTNVLHVRTIFRIHVPEATMNGAAQVPKAQVLSTERLI